jgi:hypothetical protein
LSRKNLIGKWKFYRRTAETQFAYFTDFEDGGDILRRQV